jgi:PAS domain S-box-containing protein
MAGLAGGAQLGYAAKLQHDQLISVFASRGVLLGESLSQQLSAAADRLGTMNDPGLLAKTRNRPEVLAAYILDEEGRIVTDGSGRTFGGDDRLPEFDAMRGSGRPVRGFSTSHRHGLMYVSGPIVVGKTDRGFVHLILSTQEINATIQRSAQDGAILLLAALTGILLVSSLLVSCLMRPLRRIVEAAQKLQRSVFKINLPVRSHDDIGRLSISINELARSLRNTTISKRYLDEVIQSMADSLIVVDTDANIVTVNRATLDLLGYQEPELVGQPASLVCIDEGYQLTGSRLNHLLGESTQQDHEMTYRASGGAMIPISFSGSPIVDNHGDVVGYVCIGKDISERKRAEVERDHLNRQLVDTSRQAGMAEVATGVLHNVGNVLNSVNISASVVADTVRRSRLTGLTKAVELIHDRRDDLADFLREDDKGKRLPDYLAQLSEQLVSEQSTILDEIQSLTTNIDHIKDIISMQQSYSKVKGVIETLSLLDVVEESLKINALSLERHGIDVHRQFDDVPPVTIDKHKVIQVLVNLLTNARDSVEESGTTDRTLAVVLKRDDENPGMAMAQVIDRGSGIPRENLMRIFKHGFTTKTNGHGFGLHSAALTAKELGGDLTARSDGPGQGATFTLRLPLAKVEAPT